MSNNWKKTILGDLIDIKHGFAFPGKGITSIENQNLLITPGNFEIGGGFRSSKNKYFSGEVDENLLLSHGEIIISMTDLSKEGDTLGYSAKIPTNSHYQYLHNQRIGRVISLNNDFHLDFIYWLMRSKNYRHWILSSATGSTVKHTSPKRIRSYEFLLPPIDEQKAIAHILGTLDEKIELNKKTNETLEGIAKALFKSWFVDFDPVKAKGCSTGLPKEISDLFPDSFEDSEFGKIPKGWKVSKISDICETTDYVANGSFATLKENVQRVDIYKGTEAILLRFADFNKNWEKNFSYITQDSYNFLDKSKVFPGDLVVCNVGEVGNFFRAPDLGLPMSLGPNGVLLKDFSVKGNLSNPYFYFLLSTNSFQSKLQSISSGSVQTKFNKTELRGLSTLVPPHNLIKVSTVFFSDSLSKKDKLFKQNRILKNIRDTILPNLISGKLRITDAEKIIEEVEI